MGLGLLYPILSRIPNQNLNPSPNQNHSQSRYHRCPIHRARRF